MFKAHAAQVRKHVVAAILECQVLAPNIHEESTPLQLSGQNKFKTYLI